MIAEELIIDDFDSEIQSDEIGYVQNREYSPWEDLDLVDKNFDLFANNSEE